MKISGFTFVRNGVLLDYPFEESILSLLPLVDELVVNVGQGEDDTLARVLALASQHPKIRIIENVWDDQLRQDGKILAVQTDLAMQACTGDWGVYLQADEVLHESDIASVRETIELANTIDHVDGLLFDYVHFYGDFFVVNRNPSAYRHEVRVIRLGRGIQSYRDAQGFRRLVGTSLEKLRVIHSTARIFHYGWVRPPQTMEAKTRAMDKLYHSDNQGTGDNHLYKHIIGLERFTDSHPTCMAKRIAQKRWQVDLLSQPLVFAFNDIRKIFAIWVERLTGRLPFSYKNFIRID